MGEGRFERHAWAAVGAWPAHGVAAFLDYQPRELRGAGQQGARRRIVGQQVRGDIHLHGGAQESLQERIVQFLCDAGSLRQALLEAQVHRGSTE
jgi:hypothetical protein